MNSTRKQMRALVAGHKVGSVLAVIGLFVVAGTVVLMTSRAATPFVASEVETGTITSPAQKVTDASASGGSAVQFNAGSTSGEKFTFASIPDTQNDMYSTNNITNNFNGRLNYLAANKAALNLKYVWQVGDLQDTDNLLCAVGTPASQQSTCSHDLNVNPRYMSGSIFTVDHAQYVHASNGLKILENANIPYALTIGNHDTGAVCGGPACTVVAGQTQSTPVEARNTSTWNSFYPPSRYASTGLVAFEAGKTDNAYREFTAGGVKWMVMNLELWPRTSVVDWAKSVVASHPQDNVIITTHSYATGGGGIDGSNGGYGSNTMQYVYDNLIKVYPNIRMTFSGHVGNSDYFVNTGTNGNKIYNFLDCYHDKTNNWIRLVTVDTTNNTISTKVYSPLTNATRTEATANVNITGVSWVR